MEKMKKAIRRAAEAGVYTHFGDDLDNKMSIYYLSKERFIPDGAEVQRTPAGKPKEGCLNVDVGNEGCTEAISRVGDGLAIDHHYNEHKNTLEILKEDLGISIPRQLVELTDSPSERVSSLDYTSGLALARYASPEVIHQLATDGLLDKELAQETLKTLGLKEASEKQKGIIDNALEQIKKGHINERCVHVREFLLGGSFIAYEKGYDIFASSQDHKNGGITFAVNSKSELPERILVWAEKLKQEYGSGVFVSTSNNMVVAGGPKNPDFSVNISHEDLAKVLS